jgi:UDPglucose 6-dehydrogenase
LAKKINDVVGIDIDLKRVRDLLEGKTPFFEPRLDAYLTGCLAQRSFVPTGDPKACSNCEVIFFTVSTPSATDGSIGLSHLESACATVGKAIRESSHHPLLIVKSTVIPGTTRNVVKPLLEKHSKKISGRDFGLCANPEFLREGHAIEDTEHPDRVIIGSDDRDSAEALARLQRQLTPGVANDRIISTTLENAEFIKYASNAFLAMKVSFINTIANLTEHVQRADVRTVAQGIGLDSRIGPRFLDAGLGWGGSCFPKDMKALIAFGEEHGCELELIRAAFEVNQTRPTRVLDFARTKLGSLKGKRAAVLGLSFKPDTDDIRDAVSIPIINQLSAEGASVVVYDPQAMKLAKALFGSRIAYADDAKSCLRNADLAVLVTEWMEFRTLRGQDFVSLMRSPIVFDGRRIYDPAEMQAAGVVFGAVGLGPSA